MSENVPALGKLIEGTQPRDAIHIAVMPVTCAPGETLLPGQHIGFQEGGWCVTGNPPSPYKLLGIVDPFLRSPVNAGDRFYMFLYPQTITSLRHEWSHPEISQDGYGTGSTSEKWLRDFANTVDASYPEMMAVAATHCEGESRWGADYLIEGGKWEGQSTPAEFWVHFTNVTGKSPVVDEYDGKKHTPGIFSCSC